jgi:hypothetical protein
VLNSLGYIAQRQGDAAQAREFFTEALALCREIGAQRQLAFSLAGLAGVASLIGQSERAARLFGATEALAELRQEQPTAPHRIERERNVALARVQLDEATFAAAWAEGREMSLEQAIAYALKGSTTDSEASIGPTTSAQEAPL